MGLVFDHKENLEWLDNSRALHEWCGFQLLSPANRMASYDKSGKKQQKNPTDV